MPASQGRTTPPTGSSIRGSRPLGGRADGTVRWRSHRRAAAQFGQGPSVIAQPSAGRSAVWTRSLGHCAAMAARSRPRAEGCFSRALVAGPSARLRAEFGDLLPFRRSGNRTDVRRAAASPGFRPACRVPSQAAARVRIARTRVPKGSLPPPLGCGPSMLFRRRSHRRAEASACLRPASDECVRSAGFDPCRCAPL